MKQILHYLKSNKGSGVVMVMLAMLFLTAFGTLALYLSYTQVKLGVAERTGMETEVNAYTCMDEVRAGVQQLVSDAIAETYQEVMPTYSKENENITKSFKDEFNELIVDCEYKIKDDDTTGYKLFTDNATKYDITTLEQMVRENRGYDVDIYSGSIGKGLWTAGKGEIVKKDADGKVITSMLQTAESYTLKDVTLEFTGKDGYTTTVTTDIVIECPDVGYLLTQYALKGIPNFAMVATDTIDQTFGNGGDSTDVTVNGDVYAGNVELSGNSTFKVKNYSTFICKNDISVEGGGENVKQVTDSSGNKTYTFINSPRVEFDNTSTVWAGEIKIGNLTSAAFYGDTYVSNDLVFEKNNSFVKLGSYIKNTTRRTGSYYGFGSSTTDCNASSSIIANRSGNKLSVNELGSLTLAGYAFISDYVSDTDTHRTAINPDTGNDIRMGESISSKQNQLVYYAQSGKVVYYEYKLNSDGDKINSTGHYIEGTYPGCKYYGYDESGNKVYYNDSEYAPQLESYTIEEEKITQFTKAEYAQIVKFGLVGEQFKWVDGELVYDTSYGENGYSTSPIDDSIADPTDPLYKKTFADYHAHLSAFYEVMADKYIVHFLLSFESPDDANNYYVDHYNSDPQSMLKNIASNLNVTGLNSGIARTTSGAITQNEGENAVKQLTTTEIEQIQKSSEFINEIFENYCTTLSNEPSDDPEDDTPFDTYVYKDKINEFSSDPTSTVVKEFKNSKGDVVAVIVKGDYSFTSGSSDSICLIIATGNVSVSDDFSGLILTDGSIIIKSDANFSQNYESVVAAFQATGDAGTVKDFFKKNITKDYTLEDGETTENIAAYDIDALVYYNNWTE